MNKKFLEQIFEKIDNYEKLAEHYGIKGAPPEVLREIFIETDDFQRQLKILDYKIRIGRA